MLCFIPYSYHFQFLCLPLKKVNAINFLLECQILLFTENGNSFFTLANIAVKKEMVSHPKVSFHVTIFLRKTNGKRN
jgi:hypothetical protein